MNFDPALAAQGKIKDDPDETFGIIDLDLKKTPEDLVDEWDAKVKIKLKKSIVMESEQHLNTLMTWYIQMIREEAVDFEDFKKLKLVMAKHLQFFKLYFVELNSCFVDNYLDNLEEILSFYLNLVLKSQPKNKKNGFKRRACHLISLLKMYLLNKEYRVFHILIKLKVNDVLTEEGRNLLNYLYRVFLTDEPKNKSDLGFCRAYILYHKWKMIRNPDDWKRVDEIMYTLYDRTPDCIKSNPILTEILLPQKKSTLDTLIYISENQLPVSDHYFKYIKSHKVDIDSIDDDIMPSMDDNDAPDDIDFAGDEDRELEEAYKDFVKDLSSQHADDDETSTSVNYVESDDDDCQIIAVHEISDDDLEIIAVQEPCEKKNIPRKEQKKHPPLSFLDSIELPQDSMNSTMEIVTSSKINGVDHQNTNNNSKETSASSANIVADSVTCAKSADSDMTTSEADMKSVTEAESTSLKISELCKSVSNANIASEVSTKAKVVDAVPVPKTASVDMKSVVTQTQNDWHMERLPSPFETRTEGNGIQHASTTRCSVVQEHVDPHDTPTPGPKTNYRENDFPSADGHCNSPDYLITSQGSCSESNTTTFNKQSKPTDISSTSADVSSTSMDVHDFGEPRHNTDTNSAECSHPSPTVCQVESNSVNEESYCTEEYGEYESNDPGCDNVTQSNLEDGEISIEDHDTIELAYIMYESLPIGANVNVYTEEVLANGDDRNAAEMGRGNNATHAQAVQKTGQFSSGPITVQGCDIMSPPYEAMDSYDYKIFLRQNEINVREFPSLQKATETAPFVNSLPTPKCPIDERMLKTGHSSSVRSNKKEKRVHFAKTLESQNSMPQSTRDNRKSILKKSPSERQLRKREKLRIAKVAVNLRSLEQYKVPQDDFRLLGTPYVAVEKLQKPEIEQWLKVSELSRKVRLKKEKSQHVPQLPIRVDYVSKSKILRYDSCGPVPEMFEERVQNRIQNPVIQEEGLRELSYMEKKTDKRKRQTIAMQNSSSSGAKVRSIYDKSSASGVRKTTRKRKKPDKDYDSLTVNGY